MFTKMHGVTPGHVVGGEVGGLRQNWTHSVSSVLKIAKVSGPQTQISEELLRVQFTDGNFTGMTV